jgi:CSLREA domain-containing protein
MLRRISFVFVASLFLLWVMSGGVGLSKTMSAAAPTKTAIAKPPVIPTILVNSLADDAEGCPTACTLRSAIATAQDGDIIGFESSVTGVITLNETLLIEHNITIVGPGADVLAIDGNQKVRVFRIDYSIVDMSGLTIQHGRITDEEDRGAGIYNLGKLALSDVAITDNVSQGGGGGIGSYRELSIVDSTIANNAALEFGGGGIDSNGKLTITNCTIAGNSTGQNGGGVLITDGNGGETLISNTTITANKSEFSGAGIANGSTDTGGKVTILSSTIANNVAEFEGGGVYNSSGTLTIGSSIIAGNTDEFKHPDISGEIKSKGFNLISNPGDVKGLTKTDQHNVDPVLGKLMSNAPGKTQTMALGAASPAIAKGGKACTESDQRGVKRKTPCDAGAYETENSRQRSFFR